MQQGTNRGSSLAERPGVTQWADPSMVVPAASCPLDAVSSSDMTWTKTCCRTRPAHADSYRWSCFTPFCARTGRAVPLCEVKNKGLPPVSAAGRAWRSPSPVCCSPSLPCCSWSGVSAYSVLSPWWEALGLSHFSPFPGLGFFGVHGALKPLLPCTAHDPVMPGLFRAS